MNTPHQSPTGRSRAAILDRLYQRINQFDDATLANLDDLLAQSGAFEFVEEGGAAQASVGRRAFLLALLTGGAAVAGGGATYLWLTQPEAPPKTAAAPTLSTTLQGNPIPTPAPTGSPTPGAEATLSGLRAELSTARTDLLTLRVELDTARQENTELTNTIQARQADVAYLQQVVALYEQMEAVGLDDVVSTGISPVSLSLLAIAAARGLLQAGVQEAAGLLATVEVQAPAIANGLLWLETQVNVLATALQGLEDALASIVEPVQPVAQQIGEFIDRVLDVLPFGVGENIRAGLQAVGAILTHIPELVASINPLVITPLRQWVSPEEDAGLVAEVIQPISTNLVNPAQRLVDDTAALEDTFNTGFKAPVESAIAARATLRTDLQRLTGEL